MGFRLRFCNGKWIGPQEDPVQREYLLSHLNPMGQCYCGSKKLYFDCHMKQDIMKLYNCDLLKAQYIALRFLQKFPELTGEPQKQSLELIKSTLN